MKRILMIVFAAALLCFGCATQGPIISYPKTPDLKKDSVTVTIEQKQSVIDPAEVIRDKDYFIKDRATFVISVPTDYVEESAEKDTENIRNADELSDGDSSTGRNNAARYSRAPNNIELYNTSGYFNYTEQQIEKALMKLGYRVIDRSKFEAKLREQRRIATSMHASGVVRERVDRAAFDQLRDISELVRAAQDGDIRSDYILQVNKVEIGKTYEEENLSINPEVEAFRDKYPAIAHEILKVYRFPEYSAKFNAKLIDVESGRIVWIGSHEVTSRNVLGQDINVKFILRQYVNNEKQVRKFVDEQNTEEQRKIRGKDPVKLPEWQYDYKLETSVHPDLNKLEENLEEDAASGQRFSETQDKFFNHRDKLLKLVTSMLIQTIRGY